MTFTFNPKDVVLHEAKHYLNLYRFGFEKTKVQLEYFPLEDRYFLGAKGAYQVQFDLGHTLSLEYDMMKLYRRIGLIPVWSDPVC